MGLGIVLIFWALTGTLIAGAAAFVCKSVVDRLMPQGRDSELRFEILKSSVMLPIKSVVWIGAIFVFQALVNTVFLQRDCGLGDSRHTPLQNEYCLSLQDDFETGKLYYSVANPSGDGVVDDSFGEVSNVSELQVVAPYIFGTASEGVIKTFNFYFVLDTEKRVTSRFNKLEDTQVFARERGIDLNLRPTCEIFSENRVGWFDYLSAVAMFIFPAICLWSLSISIIRYRSDCRMPS